MKILSILFIGLLLQGCFFESDEPSVELTKQGYSILHLDEKGKNLFPKLQKNEIAITYYFAWGCPHCYAFHPSLLKWLQTKPAKSVKFSKTPVSLLPQWIDLSSLYYVATKQGFVDELDLPIFNALHRKKDTLDSWSEDIAKFSLPYAQNINPKMSVDGIIDLMESSEVEKQILSDNKKVLALMMHDTPTLLVRSGDDFYSINNSTSIAKGGIITVLNQIIQQLQESK